MLVSWMNFRLRSPGLGACSVLCWTQDAGSAIACRSRRSAASVLTPGLSAADTEKLVDFLRKAQSGRRLRPGSRFARGYKYAFADIIVDLSEPDGGALSKPSPARFAVAAGRLGIGPV